VKSVTAVPGTPFQISRVIFPGSPADRRLGKPRVSAKVTMDRFAISWGMNMDGPKLGGGYVNRNYAGDGIFTLRFEIINEETLGSQWFTLRRSWND
jgi:hypothetical protein